MACRYGKQCLKSRNGFCGICWGMDSDTASDVWDAKTDFFEDVDGAAGGFFLGLFV